MENFKTNVEDIESNPNARRNFLIQLCTGKAKDAISGTVMLPPEEGYAKARSILREMFGQTHIIAASHIDRVTKGGPIKEFESEKLLQLARDMENCQMNLSSLGFHADINSRGNLSAVVLHLPRYLRSEWAKEAQNSRDQGNEPDFLHLTKFVVKKAKLANTVMVTKMFQMDFNESSYSPDVSMSIDDRKALYKMESSLKVDVDGHYQLDLPF